MSELSAAGLDPAYVTDLVARALAEDLAGGIDVTSAATVPAEQTAVGDLVARADGVVAGLPVAQAVFAAVDPAVTFATGPRDGDRVRRGDVLATVTGPTRALLTAERTALNLLCHLSGVATATAGWVDAVAGTGARIRDTRKTTPGLRALEKYAVRVRRRRQPPDVPVRRRAGQGQPRDRRRRGGEGVRAGPGRVPGPAGRGRGATRSTRSGRPSRPAPTWCCSTTCPRSRWPPRSPSRGPPASGPRPVGGLTLDTAAAVAATGVDYLSVGALTHSAPVLDIALDLRES